jgi:maltooligosyltrehalose trehalohydrolase
MLSTQQMLARPRGQGIAPRRLPIGAEVLPHDRGVALRVWAPRRRRVSVVLQEQDSRAEFELAREDNGYHSGTFAEARAGSLYRFRLDDDESLYPDPTSRFQPDGPHGPSEVIDPQTFHWTDGGWRGLPPDGQVIYEMHIGTFTREGTWEAATRRLPELADLGVTCLEVMPVAEFAGKFGWGYDGVDLFAPTRLYGRPNEFRRFVDRAHALGLGVILDVVYNHLGPDGNYLTQFSDGYFSERHHTGWGEGLNFDDGPASTSVREYIVANAQHWIEEYHLDGFRFDATDAIVDDSSEHILATIARTARQAAGDRRIILIGENEQQQTRLVRSPRVGGYGLTALWNDDFHHSAMVVLSGHSEAYYHDHLGLPQEFISAAKWGYLFQGQRYSWQRKRRGTPALDLPPHAFVNFIQNHDQIANAALPQRAHEITSPAQLRAMTALLLLMPQTPLLFQGQEFAASTSFYYFADHNEDLAKLIREGRAKELSQFPSAATPEMIAQLRPPDDPQTFEMSKLRWEERDDPRHARILQMHKDLLRLRRTEPYLWRVRRRGDIDGAVVGPNAFVLRIFAGDNGADDRLLCINFGRDLSVQIAPEPLLAPPSAKRWAILWSSEDPRYGGMGTPAPDTEQEGWFLRGCCTILLAPGPLAEAMVETRVQTSGTYPPP